MRWAWMSLTAALLALGGCKATDKKSPDRDAPGSASSRAKDKDKDTDKTGLTWLDDVKLPGGATTASVPKANSWDDPRDSATDISREGRGLLAGVVLDPDGRHAGGVNIQIEPAEAPGGPAAAPMSIVSDTQGYFLTKGLKAGQSYTLLVRVESEGRPLIAVQQARVPNPHLTIRLRDDIRPRTGGDTAAAGIPPPAAEFGPGPPAAATGSNLRDLPPPADVAAPSNDTSWTPGGATTAPLHKIVPTLPSDTTPVPSTRPVRPESITGDPRPEWRPPAASLPTPAIPTLPPPITPNLPATPADPSRSRSSSLIRSGAGIRLVDAQDRPWTFESRTGKLVLIEFMTTTCIPCKKSLPKMMAMQKTYEPYGLQVIAVVCDEKTQAERSALAAQYAREYNLNYALYVEPGREPGSVRDRLNVKSYPTAILFDSAGRELWHGIPLKDAPYLEAVIRDNLPAK